MALFTTLLRTAAPSAARLRGAHRNLHHDFSPILRSPRRPPSTTTSSPGANNAAAAPSYPSLTQRRFISVRRSDADLVKLLGKELKDDVPDEIIHDHDGQICISASVSDQIIFKVSDVVVGGNRTLRASYRDEDIVIKVLGDKTMGQLPLLVTIYKRDGTALDFSIIASSSGLHVREIYYTGRGYRDCRGPGFWFWHLDFDMKQGFMQYLERRGIQDVIAKLLRNIKLFMAN